ncbi:MAG TPA: phenylalanine--tRNA ligase subunit beta [Polyangia bacterium]|nr:phenylalanine--tRNA ligase subunit beta [Polyangia bacterium]
MKISLNWLKQLVATPLDGAELARRLTAAGLEVEARSPFGALSGVIVAEVRGKMPHPNAAKLTLVDVFDGRETTQVVCGAPNVPEPGARVLWARPGARLPSGAVLQPKEVRGIVSPGMLCAEDELGFGTSHEGIIVLRAPRFDGLEIGDDLAARLGLPDEIWEVNVTPNRPDCLGHAGIAREIAALTGAKLELPAIDAHETNAPASAQIVVEDAEGCPRYTALVLENVKVEPSPLAIRVRLASLGQRALSNVVDATNLVLHETGQPLHAFDLDRLAARTIVVRRARAGEKLTTLDGQERALGPDDVVIADAEHAVAVAGVMGGASSEVTATTTRVLLESAYFAPARVRRTAKRLGLHTEASHRFERGVDPEGAPRASRSCAALLRQFAGARVTGALIDVYPKPLEPRAVELRLGRTRALLGADVPAAEQERILGALGLDPVKRGESLIARVPPRRPDLTREVDLIEEIARVRGYDSIGATLPRLESVPAAPGTRLAERARDALMGAGFDEVVTYAFVAPERLRAFGFENFLRLANPIREELSAMRTTLIAGLTSALERNLLRGVADLKLFEVGEVFLPTTPGAQPDERRRVAGVLAGHADGWLRPGAELDLFDAKGAVEELLAALGHTSDVDYQAGREPWLHPGAQARVQVGDRDVGVLGELHPDVARALGLETRVLAFEIDLASLGAPPPVVVAEPPRFPAVTRDLSFFIAANVTAREIAHAIRAARDPLCADFRVVEDYREPGKVPAGAKGMLWSFTYRAPDRTLTDAEVQALHEALRARLQQSLRIEPR